MLERAEQLITGFGGEREKWAETTVNLEQKLKQLTGDILLAVGTIAYLGKQLCQISLVREFAASRVIMGFPLNRCDR